MIILISISPPLKQVLNGHFSTFIFGDTSFSKFGDETKRLLLPLLGFSGFGRGGFPSPLTILIPSQKCVNEKRRNVGGT